MYINEGNTSSSLEEPISRIVDYVLHNNYNVNSPGLYNGKAGIALTLFEVSRFFNNKNIEDKAFLLLQEALVMKNQDYSFENGLSGIGYLLIYLIENRFIEADFDEIFGEQYEKIISHFSGIENDPSRLLYSLKTIYFFKKAQIIKKDYRTEEIMRKIFEGLELFLLVQFFDFSDNRYINNKFHIIHMFEEYLKLVNYTKYPDVSLTLIDQYYQQFNTNKIENNYTIGHYLKNVIGINQDNKIIIENNMIYGYKNIHLDTLYLYEQIDLLSLLNNDLIDKNNQPLEKFEKKWLNVSKANLVHKIQFFLPNNAKDVGYGYGLSRLILYFINNKKILV
jgi:hypothetical protein